MHAVTLKCILVVSSRYVILQPTALSVRLHDTGDNQVLVISSNIWYCHTLYIWTLFACTVYFYSRTIIFCSCTLRIDTTLLRYIVLFNLCLPLQHSHWTVSFGHNIMHFLYAIFYLYLQTTALRQLQKPKSIDIYDNHNH